MKICRICGKELKSKYEVTNVHNKCYFNKHKEDFPKEHAKLIKDYPEFKKHMLNSDK